jgi:glycosyltransferase involved in cell wall biosynthesis
MLSVALATHNEEKMLRACLDSVKDWADEIVIADGESTDQTVAIAKEYGATVIKTTNKANFHINKQMAMDKAKGDLVLQLDADEVVDEELAAFIKTTHQKILANQPILANAWWLKRRNWFLGRFMKKGGQYPDPVIRLYQKGKAKLPQKDVHEQMVVEGEIGWAEGHLLHYGNPTFADYLRKFNTYTSFKATQLAEAELPLTTKTGWEYVVWKPVQTFFSLYIRHKGFVDGSAGFVFAAMSGLHHAVAYVKLRELVETQKK